MTFLSSVIAAVMCLIFGYLAHGKGGNAEENIIVTDITMCLILSCPCFPWL